MFALCLFFHRHVMIIDIYFFSFFLLGLPTPPSRLRAVKSDACVCCPCVVSAVYLSACEFLPVRNFLRFTHNKKCLLLYRDTDVDRVCDIILLS